MVTVTFTLTDADAARVTAACQPLGQTPRALVIAYIKGIVQAYEQTQHQTQYLASYTPVDPT